MESYPQTGESVATKSLKVKEKKDGSIRIRSTPSQRYLLKQAVEKSGKPNVSTFFWWLVEHYPDIEAARLLVENAHARTRLAKEFEVLALSDDLNAPKP